MIKIIMNSLRLKILNLFIPELYLLKEFKKQHDSQVINSSFEHPVKLYPHCLISNSTIGKYTYISENASISYSEIGRFCSLGPNILCGWGIHPLNGISSSPMFYSPSKQNGYSLSDTSKIEERKKIIIGNDVFIGANVTIIDGVSIGHGAVIGAGCVVSKDVPPYAVVVGVPMMILRYRFSEEEIEKLLSLKWWNWSDNSLKRIEKYFFNLKDFLNENHERYP